MRGLENDAGISKQCITTCGIATSPPRPRPPQQLRRDGVDVGADVPAELDAATLDLVAQLEDAVASDGERVVVDERLVDAEGSVHFHLVGHMGGATPTEPAEHR